MKRMVVLFAAVALLAGCSATPYRKGYGDVQVGVSSFQIRTWVNGFSPRSRAEDIAMLRAAELACFGEFDSFDVTEKSFLADGQITNGFMTVDYKHGTGQYDAKFLIGVMEKKLDAKSACHY